MTAKLGTGTFDGSITIAAFKGAANRVGASAGAAGRTGTPSVTLTPTTCNGLIWAAGHNWSHSTVPVPVPGQKIQHQFLDTRVGDSFWTQTVTAPTTAGSAINVADTAPTKDSWQLTAVEIPSG
jgi:hypothetical protein